MSVIALPGTVLAGCQITHRLPFTLKSSSF
jgi:hypothetical protein